MLLIQQETTLSILPKNLHQQLDALLADEYVLMNKTVNLLLSLPIVPGPEVAETVYDELKKNIKKITAFLKSHELPLKLSINNFLEKTRLSSTPILSGNTAWFQNILSDHYLTIAHINEVLNCLTPMYDAYPVFNEIKMRHHKIVEFISVYMEQIEEENLMPRLVD